MVKTGVMVGEAVRVRGCLGAPTGEADIAGQVRPFIRVFLVALKLKRGLLSNCVNPSVTSILYPGLGVFQNKGLL